MQRPRRKPAVFCLLYALLVLLLVSPVVQCGAGADEDLYKILGVSRTATVKEIKSAYRKKAKDTHPDKNIGVPPEEAAEAFRKVVHAFEVLSDENSRKHYDRTGRTDTGGSGSGRGGSGYGRRDPFADFFQWNFYRKPVRLKDKFEVQEAQSRVLHVVSLDQLKTVMLDDDELLEKHLLISFVTAGGSIETHVNDEMVFPYPFAAMSAQHIWWEDLLQTVQIRFHKKNQLTRFFNVSGDEMRSQNKPVFLFGKRGTTLELDNFARIETSDRHEFEMWVWKQLEVKVHFINEHPYPVEIYWIHGSRAHIKETLAPHHRNTHTTMLSHEWYIRDARVDTRSDSPGRWKLSEESSLGSWKIGTVEGPPMEEDGSYTIFIRPQTCFDLSGHCTFWKMQNECRKNPGFMNEVCPLTCEQCKRNNATDDGGGERAQEGGNDEL